MAKSYRLTLTNHNGEVIVSVPVPSPKKPEMKQPDWLLDWVEECSGTLWDALADYLGERTALWAGTRDAFGHL